MQPPTSPLNIRNRLAAPFICIMLLALLVPWRNTLADEQSGSVGSVRQAFFYHPSGKTTEELKANGDALFFGMQDHEAVRKLRASGYTRPVLAYMMAAELEGAANAASGGSACSTDVQPWRSTLSYEAGIFCREVHPHEDWFLHNSKGQRLFSKESGYGGTHVMYFMNPGAAGLREWMARRMAQVAQQDNWPFNGLYLDNVELSMEKVKGQLDMSDGKTQEYADDASYRAAWVGYLKQISDTLRPRSQVWGNMIADPYDGVAWDPYMDYLDGGLAEGFAAGWPRSRLSVARWERHMQQISKVLARGKAVVGVTQGDPGSNALMDFGVGCYLLLAQGDRTYFRYSQYADYKNWYSNQSFDYDLGNPLGERYQLRDGRWQRDFERGTVIVDPKNRTAEITTQIGTRPAQPSNLVSRVFVPIVGRSGEATTTTNGASSETSFENDAPTQTSSGWDEETTTLLP